MKKLTLLSLIFLTIFACRKDIDETLSTEESVNDPITTIIDYEPEVIPVNATLFGTVTDEAGIPIAGAIVRLDNNTESTDDGGRFVFKEVAMNAAGTFIEAAKSGYFPGSHRFFPAEGSINYTSIILLTKTNTGNFVSTDGGVISSPEGIQIEFPANSVVSSNGDTYEGTVEVAARWIDPTAENLQLIMPGGLQGINTSLEEVALASFGMIAVEIESASGQSLNLGNDLKATLSFPVPVELLGNAPFEIPLWYFSNTYGIWVQEGTATLEGTNYVGEVSHFSFWNCDYPYPLINLTGTVVSDAGNPIPNAGVQLTLVSGGGSGWGWTDNDGVFSGKVPKNEEFVMTISQYGACDLYTANIGPFSDDTDIGTITLTQPDLLDISGTIVDCNGDPVTNGWVDITIGDASYTYYVDNGNEVALAVYNCDGETELTVLAGNLDDLEVSDPISYTITDPLDLGNIAACGNQLPEYLILNIDGVLTTFVDVSISINGPDSSFLYAGTPGNDYNVNLVMGDIPAPGTYSGDLVQYASMFAPSSAGDVFLQCSSPTGGMCSFDEVVITVLGNVGEEVIGTFSGTGDFFDNGQQSVTLPFSAEFKIIRD